MIEIDTRLRVARGIGKTETQASVEVFEGLQRLRLRVLDDPKRRWQPRTPAMAAGLTNHIWTVKELFTVVAPPNT